MKRNEKRRCEACPNETDDYYEIDPATGKRSDKAWCKDCYERLNLLSHKTRWDSQPKDRPVVKRF
jgi:hypothetical protein